MPFAQLPALRYWRTHRLLSQRALAERAGVSIHTTQRLEHGSGARLETVRRLAEALDVTPGDLIRQLPGCDDAIVTPPRVQPARARPRRAPT